MTCKKYNNYNCWRGTNTNCIIYIIIYCRSKRRMRLQTGAWIGWQNRIQTQTRFEMSWAPNWHQKGQQKLPTSHVKTPPQSSPKSPCHPGPINPLIRQIGVRNQKQTVWCVLSSMCVSTVCPNLTPQAESQSLAQRQPAKGLRLRLDKSRHVPHESPWAIQRWNETCCGSKAD